jgi:AcrR family transcriptional regulator
VCNNLVVPAASIRARVRAEMIAEIKAVARRHLATDGANLSLRAVARDMGMVSSAIYRYFASRDDLLTALIIDAYNAVGEAVEKSEAQVGDRSDLRGRFFAVGHAVRGWALSNPAEYALIFGSPVPGYAAPQDTTVAAQRTPAVLVQILVDGHRDGELGAAAGALDVAFTDDVRRDLAAAADAIAPGLPPDILGRGTIAWIHMFGAVSFELFGQLNNVIYARDEYFDYQLAAIADVVGL